ncbi:DEAD/DEAH box helicase [Salinigranum sp. GCM10025319]|uniref:DEAD/DEAH box helicase n=1 Tax=Salinigranum sp. GCM10025319 TaxID=3252687 RepID=UPI003614F765
MDYADVYSDFDRFDQPVRSLLEGIVHNRQRWEADQEPEEAALVSEAVKYESRPVERPDRREYPDQGEDDYDPYIDEVLTDVLGFDALTPFQENCWQTLNKMRQRRSTSQDSQAAILSAPTGFGKTEGFVGPLFHDLAFNDGEGVGKVVVAYPRNALLEDQLERFLRIQHRLNSNEGAEISIGLYNGQVPSQNQGIERSLIEDGNFSLAQWTGGDEPVPLEFDYDWGRHTYELSAPEGPTFSEKEIKLSRNASIPRRGGEVPDIMLTTINSLENFGLKANYDIVDEFRTFVFDEIHMYTETYGCHAANIIRNIKASIRKRVDDETGLMFIGSSATVDQPRSLGRQLFDIPRSNVNVIRTGPEDKRTTEDTEHFHFIASAEDVGTSSTFIQQILLFAHALLDQTDEEPRKKALAFIDSVSQVNQRYFQILDFENEGRWAFHDVDEDDWEAVAEETPYQTARPIATTPGHELIRGDLNIERTSSDLRLSADQFGDTDLILSTSLLEVGIDIPAIKVVSQYRSPWEMSQFIQRIGRASREPGNDAHFLVTLGDDANDRTMFQRSERFLEPEIDTPLNADNEILRWLHNQLLRAFEIAYSVEDDRTVLNAREEFLERFLEGSDEDSLQAFYGFANAPVASLPQLLEQRVTGIDSLWSADELDATHNILETARENQELDDIADIVDVPQTRYTLQISDLAAVDDDLLDALDNRLREATTRLDELGAETDEAETTLAPIRADIEALRDSISMDPADRREQYDRISDELNRIHRSLVNCTNDIESASGEFPFNLGINDASDAAQQARNIRDDDELVSRRRIWGRAYHLQRALQELYCFINQVTDEGHIYSHKTVPAIKALLRAVYFHSRAVTLDQDRAELQPPFYFPTSYFGETGETFSLVADDADQSGRDMDNVDSLYQRRFEQRDNDTDETEVPITKLFFEYVPYMSKYREDRSLELFNPPIEPAPDEDDVDYYFDIEGLQTEPGEEVVTPRTIPVRQVEDQSGNRAQSIVWFCQDSLYVARSHADPGPHGSDRMEYGKLRSHPQITTSFEPERPPSGPIGVAYVDADVRLDAVTLSITPANPMGDPTSGDSTPFSPQYDHEYDEEIAFRQPLGFSLKTRGELWDISAFLETLQDDADFVERFETHNPDAELEDVGRYTAAHFLLGIVSDVSGVNQSQLLYGIDRATNEVAVFERAEGGQGVVDLFDMVRQQNDHERLLSAINRVATNAQLINGRLWSDENFVTAAHQDDIDELRDLIREAVPVPTETVVERVSQVARSTIDQLNEFVEVTGVNEQRAFELRQQAARMQFVEGNHDPVDDLLLDIAEDVEAAEVRNLLVEPDVDGCVENLHLAYSIVGGDQSDVLSYLVLERLHEHVTTSGDPDDWGQEMIEHEALPGANIDGTNVFHSL